MFCRCRKRNIIPIIFKNNFMKTLYIIVAGFVLLTLSVSCEKDYSLFKTTDCYLNFNYGDVTSEEVTEGMSTTFYSFVYEGDDVKVDTLWFEVVAMGFLSEIDRPLVLKQLPVEGVDNAVPGVHYVAFDDTDLAKFYRIPRGQNTARIPVVLLRNDPELQKKAMALKFGFGENEFFSPGYEGLIVHTIQISDFLTEPVGWWRANMGSYGQVKHHLMIQWTGEPWDEAYIKVFGTGDAAYRSYMRQWFRRKLAEENAKRLADPEIGDVYREADGRVVSF